jgi:hypothetical protein
MTRAIDGTLAPLESSDPFLRSAIEAMLPLLGDDSAATGLTNTKLYIVDYQFAPAPIKKGKYYTPNCAALLDEADVIMNEEYLLEA